MTLNNLVRRQFQEILKGDQDLQDDLAKLEGGLYKRIVNLMADMDRVDGRIVLNDRNRRILVLISVELDKATTKGIQAPLEKWLRVFDQVDTTSGEMFALMGVEAGGAISDVRKLTVDVLANRLTNYRNISDEITQPIKQILGRHLLSQVTFRDAEAELRHFIQTTVDRAADTGDPTVSLGRVNRWAKQLTKDALNQYDGAIKQRVQQELNMDSFRYIGTIKDTTRDNCRMMLSKGPVLEVPRGSGKKARVEVIDNKFHKFRQDDGGYLVADIPEIIALSEGGKGWIPDTTPDNYIINRGGYACRHMVMPYIYNSRRAQRVLKDLNEII